MAQSSVNDFVALEVHVAFGRALTSFNDIC